MIIRFSCGILNPISIMLFLNLFLIFRLLYMATIYTIKKDVRLTNSECMKENFQIDLGLQGSNFKICLKYLFCLFTMFAEYHFQNYNQLDIILCWCL